MDDVLALLHDADPVPDEIGYPDQVIEVNTAAILRADGGTGSAHAPGSLSMARRVAVGVLAVAAVSAAAIATDVVAWPRSHGATESMAEGITRHADGSVDLLIHWNEVKDPKRLQAQLQAAGIPAVVIVESPAGTCNEPHQEGIMDGYAAVLAAPLSETTPQQHEEGFIIRPSYLPKGTVIVFSLLFPGEPMSDRPGFVGMYITDQAPPTCIPQSIFPPRAASEPSTSPVEPSVAPS
jgi:hypothetical protein